jgi:Rps23 Pro-64 3,4-dihydroxylase Tpa1-like proline 4-hydroxylase
MVLREWPNDNLEQHNDGTFVRKKQGTTWKTQFGPYTLRYLADLASPQLLLALEKLTGIWGLIPDPYLFGGGLHATAPGGKLAIHADFNKHFRFKLDRRLNLLVFLNEGWSEENGGWLELWDEQMQSCAQRVLPVFNRTVIFSTTRTSYHGQPEPIVGPPDLLRRSIALYFYSNGRADEGAPPDASGQHTTLWQERPGRGY